MVKNIIFFYNEVIHGIGPIWGAHGDPIFKKMFMRIALVFDGSTMNLGYAPSLC